MLSVLKRPSSLTLFASECNMSRLRKVQNTEGQRRSPRISALEAETHDHSMRSRLDNAQGPAFRTRGRNNTKLMPLQQFTSSPNQGVKHSGHQDIQKKSDDDKPPKRPSSPFLPDKRILQLVLDTLQRRDTYEIFAEPVDPNEVEDYYAIIEEPMDFGTMRAKLHEGMYKSLEQFEHDVFLIFDNAMNFNSSGTIYFRQARVINELAKKVFDLLKNNPEKFELEFSETRRKVSRRSQGDFRDSTDLKPSEKTTGVSVTSKTVPCSSRGTSNKRSFKTSHGCSDIAKHVDARDIEINEGTKDSSRCRPFEIDRRCTYRPVSLDNDKSLFSTVSGKLKLLELVNQQEIGYKDSLMMFVKGLGPIAQNIAKRKLLGCEIHTASTSAPREPDTSNKVTAFAVMSKYPLVNTSASENVEEKLNAEREKSSLGCHRWSLGCDKEFLNRSFCSDSRYSQACAPDEGSKETGNKSNRMLLDSSKLVNREKFSGSVLENSQASSSALESRLENNCEFQSHPWVRESSDVSCFVQDKSHMQHNFMFRSECVKGDHHEAVCPTNEISYSSEAIKILKSDNQTVPLASGFVFNLPPLKTRFNQINSPGSYQGVLIRNPPTNTLCFHNQHINNP